METEQPFNNTRSKQGNQHKHKHKSNPNKDRRKKLHQPNDVDQYGNISELIDYDYQSDCENSPEFDCTSQNKSKLRSTRRSTHEDTTIDLDLSDMSKDNTAMKQLLTKYLVTRVVERLENDEDGEIIDELEQLPGSDEYTEEEEIYIESLSKRDRRLIKKLERRLTKYSEHKVPYRFQILRSKLDMTTKSMIINKLEQLYMMEPSEGEYHKLNRWIDGVMGIPFDRFTKPVVTNQDSLPKIATFIRTTKECLDEAVYGHQEAKTLILQAVAQQITNPNAKGSIIALQGPMGNGKTTLIKKGVSRAMKRPFAFIALGGATDSCFLDGHDFTYEGSQPGRIISILKECKAMDPIIYFDELDKISDTPKGEEIANLLCHLTDHSQNTQFHDKYFSGIDFDLSKASFIFSFNNRSAVNPILLDRMNVIETKGFATKDKLQIASKYLLPDICENIGFSQSDIVFTDEIITHIISHHTDEQGVRNLKRCLETIISKLNLLKIVQCQTDTSTKSEITDSTTGTDTTSDPLIRLDTDTLTLASSKPLALNETSTSANETIVVVSAPTLSEDTDSKPTDKPMTETVISVSKTASLGVVQPLSEDTDSKHTATAKTDTVDKANNSDVVINHSESDPTPSSEPHITMTVKKPEGKGKGKGKVNGKPNKLTTTDSEESIVPYEIKNLKFPITITREVVEKFLKLPEKNPSHAFLYM
jgi:ATP-dependent Lon protease